jgi:hypothetical protein
MRYWLLNALISVATLLHADNRVDTDSLIALNRDISLRFYHSLAFRSQYSLDLALAFQIKPGVKILDFYYNKRKLSRKKEQVIELFNDEPRVPEWQYFNLKGLRTTLSINDVHQPRFKPTEQIRVQYTKNRKTYSVLVPLEAIRTSTKSYPGDEK